MKALIFENKVIQIEENEFPVAAPLEWTPCPDNCEVGWGYNDEVFTPPESVPEPVILGVLATDTWTIPADGETFATVTYTSDTTVYFAVESEIHTIEAVDQIATLEVSADAIGPIRIDVQDQRLVIAALEV